MTTDRSVIVCEMCGLAHRVGADLCDSCRHVLGTPIDVDALRTEAAVLRGKMARAIAAIVAMLAVNLWAFRGAGVIVLLAPIGWLCSSGLRYRAVTQVLAKSAPRT